jgi:hypothetical protein
MTPEDDDAAAKVADAAEEADFASGFPGKPAEKPAAAKPAAKPDKPETAGRSAGHQSASRPDPAATPRAGLSNSAFRGREPNGAETLSNQTLGKPEPKYVQITEADWAEVRAAAAKTASYDSQLSKAFGTIGNLQKLVNGFQAQTPAGRKIEIPKDAFAAMERDFPELAQQTRAALEAALSGVTGTGAADADATPTFKSLIAAERAREQVEDLEDAFPSWREIVGAVDVSKQQPDPDNPFRKWLATKDAAYQNRINGSESAAIIGRAIRLFQNETKAAPAKPATTPRDIARAERIRGAVQPRGDNAGAAAGTTDDEEFVAGFNSR